MNAKERFELMVDSGRVTMPIDMFHEKAEALLGHPIWTHEFGMEETWLEMKIRLLTHHKSDRTQSPIETVLKMVPPKNWREEV